MADFIPYIKSNSLPNFIVVFCPLLVLLLTVLLPLSSSYLLSGLVIIHQPFPAGSFRLQINLHRALEATMSTVQIVPGFSVLNRWLLYTSFMLAPAQFLSGWQSNCPSNIGFLVYNWYTQISWYRAIKLKKLHALSMLPVHYNTICTLTYLGGITSGNYPMAIILGFGTAGVILLNNIAGWASWTTNQIEGFGQYRFFFWGWRTLSPAWHKFFLVWQISDSLEAFVFFFVAITGAVSAAKEREKAPWWFRYAAIPLGAVLMLVIGWDLILWTELVVSGNHLESATDWIAVWLFIAQVVTMLIPSCGL